MGQRFGRILASLHFAVDDAAVLAVTGHMMHLGDETGVLKNIEII